MFEQFHVVVGEVNPNLHAVEALVVFWRNETKSIDVFRVFKIFPHQEEHQVGVDLLLVLLVTVDREYESPSLLVTRVLPLGLDAQLEVLDGVDPTPLLFDEVTK